jgi:4-hydroxy-4-methyl-2-oxoglutarate aldolase
MLEDPPRLVVKRQWLRPAPDRLAVLRAAQTGHIVDCLDGRGALDAAIKPIDPRRARFVGTALTVETGPSDNLAILAALTLAQRGDCLIVAADAFAGTAVVGDNVCWMARNAGVAALVVDGMCRDLDGMLGIGLPLFTRGITPNSCVRSGPGRIGVPIVAGGVAVSSGDVMVGDRDGVVIIPAADLDAVLARLDGIRHAEAAVQRTLAAGATHLDAIATMMRSDQVKYID